MDRTHIITLLVLTLVLTILVCGEVMAQYCYQETANVSTSCGGNSGGNYTLTGDWSNPDRLFDGDWGTYAVDTGTNPYFYINYVKPIRALNSSLWRVKGQALTDQNISIPSGCWFDDISTLKFRVYSVAGASSDWSCYNYSSSTWITIASDATSGNVWEEAMWWDLAGGYTGYISYPLSVLEYSNPSFNLSFTYDNSIVSNITANLTYNGTTYKATGTNSSSTWNFTKAISIPAISAAYNETKSFYWTYYVQYVDGENVTYNTSTYDQSIFRLRIQNTTTSSVLTINFTVRDEKTSALVRADATSSWKIWAIGNSEATQSRSYSYLNKNATIYPYYLYPTWTNATVRYSILLENSSYSPRTFSSIITVSNSSVNQTLYMLKIEDGAYVTFQVINAANEPISGVGITAEKDIVGTWTTIQQGITDTAGSYTFFLDPTTIHRFNFTKTGYDFYSTQLTPTQSIYTLTLAQIGAGGGQSYNRGITYRIEPTNVTLLNNTEYTFVFNITSEFYSLQECGFSLKNISGDELGSDTDTELVNCYAFNPINTGNNSRVTMYYYWKINDTYMNGTYSWYVKYTVKGQYSIAVLIDDIRNFADNRTGGFDDFGLMLIVFLIIFILTAKLAYESGIYSPLAILGFITACVFFADYCNLLPHVGNIPYFTTIMIGIIWVAYTIHEYA